MPHVLMISAARFVIEDAADERDERKIVIFLLTIIDA
jgi:hypothetical protein